MDADQEHSGPEEQSRDVYRVSPLPVGLCEMLREEWFLRTVLEHVGQFGLEACRLVSRQWRAICQELPYNLTVRTHKQDLERALAVYPNATSVTMMFCDEPVKDADFFSLLSNAHALSSLQLSVGVLELTDCVQHSFQSIPQLKELVLGLEPIPGAADLLGSVRNLTDLTYLELLLQDRYPPPVEPFVELKEICSLAVNLSLFTDANGLCLFPSLTNLTSLRVGTPWNIDSAHGLSLEVRRIIFGVHT